MGKISKVAEQIFSERELQVIKLVCEQFDNREISKKLGISLALVNDYERTILIKTKSKNGVGILFYAIRNGIFKI